MDSILEWLHIIKPRSQDSNGVMCEKNLENSLKFCIKIIHYYYYDTIRLSSQSAYIISINMLRRKKYDDFFLMCVKLAGCMT